MSDLKHTPGSWGEGVYEWCIVTDDDTPVAQAETGNPNWRENALLIAAAPELFAVAAQIVSAWVSVPDANAPDQVNLARAAVAKARGK